MRLGPKAKMGNPSPSAARNRYSLEFAWGEPFSAFIRGGLVILLYELQSRIGAGGSEKGSRRAMPVR